MVDLNKTLITLRESFQRNIGVEVLFEDKTLELTPHKLVKEPNGDIVLFASEGNFSTPQKYLVKDIQGVRLDVSNGVPSDLSWDEDYINSRSFAVSGQEKNNVVKLDFSNEPDFIDTSLPGQSKRKKNKKVIVAARNKTTGQVKKVSFNSQDKKEPSTLKNGITHSPKVYWSIISVIAILILGFVIFKPFERNLFEPSPKEKLASEYEAWLLADGDKNSVWKKEQDIVLDNLEIKGEYSKYDKIDWRLPFNYDDPNGWYRGFDLRNELADKIDVDALIEQAKKDDIYSSLMNDWSPAKDEEGKTLSSYYETTYYQSYYSPERKCTIWHNDMNPILLSKERISELGYDKNDLELTRYYAKEIISKISDDPNVQVVEEKSSVYLNSSRYKMESLDYNFDNINLTVRAFSERGTVLYIYNDCGMNIEELEKDASFIVEISGYPYLLSDNNPQQPESILRR